MSRLIDADAFADYIKKASLAKKYDCLKIGGILTVADVLDAVVAELDGSSLDGYKNAPIIEDLSDFCDKLWRGAYERGKAEGKAERKTGKWIKRTGWYEIGYKCSECDKFSLVETPYCSECGAKMEAENAEALESDEKK